MITFLDGKIKELKIFGQLLLESKKARERAKIRLDPRLWSETQSLQKRVSPSSQKIIRNFANDELEVELEERIEEGKSLLDYIVASKMVKIPLLAFYKTGGNEENTITLQFKVIRLNKIKRVKWGLGFIKEEVF
jgi:hypothetical protein